MRTLRVFNLVPVVGVLLALAPWRASSAAATLPALRATVVATGLSLPLAFVQDPTDPRVQFVVEQFGRIRIIRDGVLLSDDFLNLAGQIDFGGERGLLGLAFAPDYGISRRFFVNFTNTQNNTVVARYRRSASNPLMADPDSRFDLKWSDGNRFITQPYANHNAGDLQFGSDGYLYIPMGDGGSGNDPEHRAQDPTTLLGKIIRIDVNVADSDPEGYDLPPDNPFLGQSGVLPEIWAFGLRNPFRFTVDARERGGNGALYIGDVGQSAYEEVDYEPFGAGGRNYGWRNREGAHDNVTSRPPAFLPLVDPIIEYDRSVGTTVIGGVVNRGTSLGVAFFGRYFFADFGQQKVWSVRVTVPPSTGQVTVSPVVEHTSELGAALGTSLGNITAFGIDASCRVYFVDWSGGRVIRIESSVAGLPAMCATPDPFLAMGGGIFFNGGWFPPDYPGLDDSPPSPTPPPAPPSPPPSPSPIPCVGPPPGDNWVCVNGGWVPPDHPLAGGAPAPSPTPPPPSPTPCVGPPPGENWVCVNGGWVPPDHPLAKGGGDSQGAEKRTLRW